MDFNEYLQPGIYAITGKPGAGKSYFSTRVILAEIERENRNIITNIPINKKPMREMAGKDFYTYELETFTDNRFFFTQRGDYSYELEDGESETIDFSKYLKEHDEGCLYIIDEAHLYFNSRNWKHMAQATLSFFTFIRHCGDTLIYLTQKFSDVDSQLRGKTQTFNLIRNLSRERLGLLRRGNGFRVYQYLREKDIENYDNASQDFTYPFKKSVAKCYETSLFNKKRDENTKLKGITVKQVIIAACVLFAGVLYWIASGGWLDTVNLVVPEIAQSIDTLEIEEGETKVNAQVSPLPFEMQEVPQVVDFVDYEMPVTVMGNLGAERFRNITKDQAAKYDALIFGQRRICKLSFFVDKHDREIGAELSFSALWSEFAKMNSLSASMTSFSGSVQTDVFSAFLAFARDKSDSSTLKEVTIILKESVPCVLSQGYEIPLARTVGTQGVLQTNYEYRQVGFDLEMIMESINDRELLSVKVTNNQVLDQTAQVPAMLSFKSENVYDVENGQTYEIAQFESKVEETTKKILGKRTIESQVNNRVFLSYGQ